MSRLIKSGQVVSNEWKVLRLADGEAAQDVRLPVGQVLVPLQVWKARRRELIHREYEHGWALGIWLAADENLQGIECDIDDFSVVAVEFDKFSDGNGYLVPRLLRERYGYQGELRAMGDVPEDSLFYLHQIGFDTVELGVDDLVESAFSRRFDFSQVATEGKLLAA